MKLTIEEKGREQILCLTAFFPAIYPLTTSVIFFGRSLDSRGIFFDLIFCLMSVGNMVLLSVLNAKAERKTATSQFSE